MTTIHYPIVQPVIELGFNAIQLNSTEKELALEIKKRAAIRGYVKTPGGWYVPLSDVRANIDIVAEFIRHETLHFDEFEIGGGFLISISSKESLDIPPDSTFRFAMDLANNIINIEPGDSHNVAVGTQEFWNVSADKLFDEIRILRKGEKEAIIKIPIEPLKLRFREARSLIIDFATDLENSLKSFEDLHVASDEIKYWFVLDKVSDKR